jgi:Protein of unknown function (DUF3667)
VRSTASALPSIDLSEPLTFVPASDRPDPPVEAAVRCANCQATNVGNFCAECGAPRLDSRPVTVRRFFNDAWNELTSLDSSTMLTIRALVTRPGELTRAYLDGRTRWFLPPLRVYLLAFGLYILGQSFMNDDYESQIKASITKAQAGAMAKQVKAGTAPASLSPTAAPVRDEARARRRAKAQAVMGTLSTRTTNALLAATRNPWLAALNVFPVALALSLLYRRRRRNYAEHVVMAVHVLAANSLLLLLNAAVHVALGIPRGHLDAISMAHWLLIGTYFFFAARRVHEEARPATAGKSVLFVAATQLTMIVIPGLIAATVAAQVVFEAMVASRG